MHGRSLQRVRGGELDSACAARWGLVEVSAMALSSVQALAFAGRKTGYHEAACAAAAVHGGVR